MKYQLVLQWSGSSLKDYDETIAIEDKLIENLSKGGKVDGHDAGSGEVNIFILTDDPERTFSEAKAILGNSDRWLSVRVAYRKITKDHYTILWPEDLTDFDVI
jgi:ribosomal 30S subunit maturation factor RimM